MTMLRRAAGMFVGVATVVALATSGPAVAEEPAGVSLEIERVVQGSKDQIVAWAGSAFAEIQGHVRALARLDAEVRKKIKGGEGLACVSTALETARALQDSTVTAPKSAADMMDAGNQRLAIFELRKLSVAVTQARALRTEAEKCALGSGVQAGDSRTTLEGAAAADAIGALPNDILSYAFDPPQTSPF
jgi:hypothetical protein